MMFTPDHPAPVRALLAAVDVCRRLLCTVNLHRWQPSRFLNSRLERCERSGCHAARSRPLAAAERAALRRRAK